MSYLDVPRLYFSGKFFTDPSTINNYPANYDPQRNTPEQMELGWNPMGSSKFALLDCKVTQVCYQDGSIQTSSGNDSIIDQCVGNINSPSAKLVDLDPEQQGVSEIWGMQLRIGDDELDAPSVSGDYQPAAFANMVTRTPPEGNIRSSANAGAIYQSVLTNLGWLNINNTGNPSPFLKELKEASPNRLSIKFCADLHNNKPYTYKLDENAINGIEQGLYDKLIPITTYNPGEDKGIIPTEDYFRFLLQQYLISGEDRLLIEEIVIASQQSYTPWVEDKPFLQGRIIGSIGPAWDDEADFITPMRMLQKNLDDSGLSYAPFKIDPTRGKLVLDLGNSLPTTAVAVDDDDDGVVTGEIDKDRYGTQLNLGYLTEEDGESLFNLLEDITPRVDSNGFLAQQAGLLEIDLWPGDASAAEQQGILEAVNTSPFVLTGGQSADTDESLLFEQPDGYFVRADQFVFRMNSEVDGNDPLGNEAVVNIYAYQFGEPATGFNLDLAIEFDLLDLPEASVSALTITAIDQGEVDNLGKASFEIKAGNPGNPRDYLDGQLYPLVYTPQTLDNYNPDPTDFISVQIYQDVTMPAGEMLTWTNNRRATERRKRRMLAGETLTWTNSIKAILGLYGKLYPVMTGRGIDLADYQSVKANGEIIRTSLETGFDEPGYMPVTRDLSKSKLQLVIDWMDEGMPE